MISEQNFEREMRSQSHQELGKNMLDRRSSQCKVLGQGDLQCWGWWEASLAEAGRQGAGEEVSTERCAFGKAGLSILVGPWKDGYPGS